MGNSIEPLVIGVDALVEQAKFMGLQGGGYEERYITKERAGHAQIATPKTEASPPSTLGDDGQRDAPSITL